MLAEKYDRQYVREHLLPLEGFHPLPKIGEQGGWTCASPEIKREYIAMAESYLNFTWPFNFIENFLHFYRTGQNFPFLKVFWERRSVLGILVIAECMEDKGRFLDQIVNGIYCICEETSWITPFDLMKNKEALPSPKDRIVDLSCSETGSLLAWTAYLLGERLDRISLRICARISDEIRSRLIEPYLEHEDYWWMGFVETPRVNNWNPWCNRNMLMCFLLTEKDMETRTAGVYKIMRSLDVFLRRYPPDGCCDEGPMYWGAAGGGLHVCLSLLHKASSGKIDIYGEPIVQEIGRYIYKAHIHGNYFVDFADGDAVFEINPLIYGYGLALGDENMVRLGACAETEKPVICNWFVFYEYALGIFEEQGRKKAAVNAPYVKAAWLWYTQVMTAREKEGSEQGLFLAAKGGHNAEAHNHNDVGNFIVYIDGKPLLIDLGTEEYTAKTFSPQRFELWYLQSQYHNCPSVGSVLQKDGERYAAKNANCSLTDSCAELTMDISGAYPADAGISAWIRTCRLNRTDGASIEITDDYKLIVPSKDTRYNLMTPCKPSLASDGLIELEYAKGRFALIRYDAECLEAHVESIRLEESRLRRNWGEMMYRVILHEKEAVTGGKRTMTITRGRRQE